MESCIYVEECVWRRDCVKPCSKYQERKPLAFVLSVLFLACAILYIAGFVTFGIGRAMGKEEGRAERVSRATCMQHTISLEDQGIHYSWKKGGIK